MVKEQWLEEAPPLVNVCDYVSKMTNRLKMTCEVAKTNLKQAQSRMKKRYDEHARSRVFSPGDKVLVLLPVRGKPLRAIFSGPYRVVEKTSSVNYIIETPGRRKATKLCHINMLKPYYERGIR